MFSLLLLCLGLPVITAILLLLFRGSSSTETARWIALSGAVATVLAAGALFSEYQRLPVPETASATPVQLRFEFERPWLSTNATEPGGLSLTMHLGLDGISVSMILLTALLGFSAVLISWETIQNRSTEFYAALLALEAAVIGVFCSFDLILFYAFFEFTLIPLFFLMIVWGGPNRRSAALTFFLFTFCGSLFTLLGLIALALTAANAGVVNPTSIPALAEWLKTSPLTPGLQEAFFLAIAVGFLVKVPVVPFHSWLPNTYAEAPTAGTVFASGLLAKMGVYGFLRLCIPMFPDACLTIGVPLMGTLAAIGVIYGSLCALAQKDIKRLVAYSSIAHLGFCILGIFALNVEGLTGGVLQMVNHGLSTGALFLLVAMLTDRYGTRQIEHFGGIAFRLPLLAISMVFISMASIGLPGLNGFTGEFLSLAGMFARHPLYAVLGTTGVILGAWYLLTLLQTVYFGPTREPKAASEPVRDINIREVLALVPLAALCLGIGVYPKPLVDVIRPDVESIAALYSHKENSTGAPVAVTSVAEQRAP